MDSDKVAAVTHKTSYYSISTFDLNHTLINCNLIMFPNYSTNRPEQPQFYFFQKNKLLLSNKLKMNIRVYACDKLNFITTVLNLEFKLIGMAF